MSEQFKIIVPVPNMGMLDYLAPDDMQLSEGDFVIVPFRNKKLPGIVVSKSNDAIPKLRFIETKLDLIKVNKDNIEFIKWVAAYNITFIGAIAKMLLPIPNIFAKRNIANYKVKNQNFPTNLPPLSAPQEEAYLDIKSKKGFAPIILAGVTGSGKTEVYFKLIKDIIENNEQALILLPEITLATQITERFCLRFGFSPAEWHSGQTIAEKKKIWLGVLNNDIKIVIGARSALFLPFNNLKLIVVDEEHDQSYKQEDGTVYQARDMAVARAMFGKATILLGSATPSLESLYNHKIGKYELIELPTRFGGAMLPTTKIVDLRKSVMKNGTWISEELKTLVEQNLADKKQTILFLNRRGYAPLTICRACGHRLTCPLCSAWLVEHKAIHRLKCHHCGHNEILPNKCPECNAEDKLIACGPGIERITEEISNLLPTARVAMMSGDLIDNKESATNLINSILNNEVDIIVGTQMIAKGLHFPNITLIGIIDADLGLAGSDLRGAERTYQLLAQVSGRAGRELAHGVVVLQTYNPDNAIIQSLIANNTKEFLNNELKGRELYGMPPFRRLAAIIFSSEDEDKVKAYASKFVKIAPRDSNVEILGPAQALIYKLRGKYRYRILVKGGQKFNMQNYLSKWLNQNLKADTSISVKIDIDPYNFF